MIPKLIMFDLDQTLAESKQPVTEEMAELLARLIVKTKVAVTSGGKLAQFLAQVARRLPASANLVNLYLLPTSGAALYEWRENAWQNVYEEKLSEEDAARIAEAIRAVSEETGVIDFNSPAWGARIENRGSQVSVSALGQEAPLAAKRAWDPDKAKRRKFYAALAPRLPGYTVRMGGLTTIDITKEGVDKAYGVRKLSERLHIPIREMLYVGDELEEGGNDEVVTTTGIPTRAVAGPRDTIELVSGLLGP